LKCLPGETRCSGTCSKDAVNCHSHCLVSAWLLRLRKPAGDLVKLIQNYIDGSFVPGKQEFADINPADGTTIAKVTAADEAQVGGAVHAARLALHGEWGRLAVRERAARLHKVADAIEKRFDCFVQAEVADTGKPVSLASNLDIPRAAANFRVFADLVKMAGLESFQTETLDGANALNYAVRKPLGVVGIVTPWNLPLLLLTWKVAPALACGNTVVVKPSEETPATATLLSEAMQDAGIPHGVYNVVHGFGPGSAGEFLTQHPDVDAITFTGESKTGAAIMKAVAPTVKPISFELGGKNAAIVFRGLQF
jgi:aminomuconate-semialdehyde/2-hydroxymuconate-6-semialdehyde dehydrogenase